MNTLLDISNMALDLLGENHIQTFDGTDKNSKILNIWSNLVFESTLARYKPNFCTKTTTLQFNHITGGYQLPADYIVIVNKGDVKEFEFIRRGNILEPAEVATKTPATVDIEYISNDSNLLATASGSFKIALAYDIGASIAYQLTKEPSIAEGLYQQAILKWNQYNITNNHERRPTRFMENYNNSLTWSNHRR